ncbi:MAG: ABC transporter permease [Phycisphaerales bacterium]|nr:ABC transporter permease [Phycisphaerales bacterium]
MSILITTLSIGLVLAVLGLGVHIAFRVFGFSDITADGSFPLGAAVAAALIIAEVDPFIATAIAGAAGGAAGAITGVLNTRFKINPLLAGILTMTALYTVNLRVMGKSNIGLLGKATVFTPAESLLTSLVSGASHCTLLGRDVAVQDLACLAVSGVIVLICSVALWWFLRTEIGAAMRATGDNGAMVRALGGNTDRLLICGLALANALIALSGGLLAQLQSFADVQMGIGIIVLGLASVIIGQTLVGGGASVGVSIVGVIMGSVLFRLLIAIALRMGLDPNDLKLITAVVVLVALVVPSALGRVRPRPRRSMA